MDAHTEHTEEEFKMDYSEWHPINFIPLVILVGFLIGVITIFV